MDNENDIVLADEIWTKRDIGGKNPLLICRYCFEMYVEIPCSGGCTNMKEKMNHEGEEEEGKCSEWAQEGSEGLPLQAFQLASTLMTAEALPLVCNTH